MPFFLYRKFAKSFENFSKIIQIYTFFFFLILKKFPKILTQNGKNISKEKALLNIVVTIGACKISTVRN